MELSKDNSSSLDNLAADGDVILVVGPEQVKFRVHSLFLKTVSKPFSALLGPDWMEGRNMLDRDGPVEVLLPEDNADALKLICAIIHHQNNEVPQILAAEDVLGVAVTADKYDCVEALKFASGNWLQPGKFKARDLMLVTAAAYLLQNAKAFKEITTALILNYDGPYLDLLCEDVESAITWKVFCLLEAQRSSARLKLAELLAAGINDGLHAHGCKWTSKYVHAYSTSLRTWDLWPLSCLQRISISAAIDLAEEIPDPIPKKPSTTYKCERIDDATEYRKQRRWSLADLDASIGLCLPCVRSGSTDSYCNDRSHRA